MLGPGAVPPGARSTPPAKAPPATYYLALGDSLSQGVQPNAAGVSVMTRDGYADQVYAALHPSRPGLKLVKLGCPGETTASMINGGICRYRDGSQLAAAVAFLQAHRGRVLLVTLDIGANDPEHCGGEPGLSQLAKCAVTDVPAAVGNLGTITTRLKAAAGPGVRIVGMTYYLPALAEWRSGLPGHVVAWTAEKLAATYNRLLTRVIRQVGSPGRERVRRLRDLRLHQASRHERPAQRRPAVPVDLAVRRPAPRAQPARQPGRLPGHRPRVPASLRPELTSPVSGRPAAGSCADEIAVFWGRGQSGWLRAGRRSRGRTRPVCAILTLPPAGDAG